ncbi:L,D-transpeptidase family protein [Agathobaculum sp.]|uniref:L,D-transpeptidase family protein n=1 Tax=Agathobaculum sp. TaxID=2048138 RepID=UPI002A7FD2E4|nr:L,D-transpeptidase family protein [Agathobaculum sp.]MDY3618022.1 S-layer homology domain-containing protein [Agathobaculum sp.]
MNKRMISGLLAALMVLTGASAAGEGGEAAPQEPAEKTLTLEAQLYEEYDSGELLDDMAAAKATLEKRLERLGYGQTSAVAVDEISLTVTLPDEADEAAAAEVLTAVGQVSIQDADGKEWLDGADIDQAKPSFGKPVGAELTDEFYLIIAFTPEGAKKFTQATEAVAGRTDGQNVLHLMVDGEVIASPKVSAKVESASCVVRGDFTEASARKQAALLGSGTLPFPLTAVDAETPDGGDKPEDSGFPDAAGHWAEDALNRAVELGLLKGSNGLLKPDDMVKRAEALTILNRALGASLEDDISGLSGVPEKAWYRAELAKALHIGLIDADDSRNFDTGATRAEAFVLLARAFGFAGVPGDSDALAPFDDTGAMTAQQQAAAAALVSAGIVKGDKPDKLAPDAALTRAQFVTMITRIAPNFIDTEGYLEAIQGGSLLLTPENKIEDMTVSGDLVFPVAAETIALKDLTVPGRVVLKGAEQATLAVSGKSALGLLALDPAGTAKATLSAESTLGTLLVSGRGGAVSYKGAAENIEITASGREIELSGVEAARLVVTGAGNTITVKGAAAEVVLSGENNVFTMTGDADSLLITGAGCTAKMGGAVGAADVRGHKTALTLNGKTGTVVMAGRNSTVDGKGKAESVDVRAVGCEITLSADSKTESLDPGLDGVGIKFGVPTKVVPGGSLLTQVTFSGVSEEKIVKAQWYQDGKALPNYGNDHFRLTASAVSKHTSYFTFTKDMQKSVKMGFKLTYENPSTGEVEEVFEEVTVPIENYSEEWYYQRDVNRVLNLVSSEYRGNYTTAYAVNNDYKEYEKEVWINAKGYSSKTQYLLWINRAYQHVNVFSGSKGNWDLIKSFVVGTGASSTPTPTGVTTVSYKSAGGWTTSTYTVRPVVGFYPGTGYAFHSRLCYPGTEKEYDFSSGYPVSHGCVRMQRNDINWIYNNIPVGTAVVIF